MRTCLSLVLLAAVSAAPLAAQRATEPPEFHGLHLGMRRDGFESLLRAPGKPVSCDRDPASGGYVCVAQGVVLPGDTTHWGEVRALFEPREESAISFVVGREVGRASVAEDLRRTWTAAYGAPACTTQEGMRQCIWGIGTVVLRLVSGAEAMVLNLTDTTAMARLSRRAGPPR